MPDQFYAWSDIRVGDAKGAEKVIKVGDVVTAKDLGADDATWNSYLESGAVRPYPYPDMPQTANQQSPLDFMRQQVTKDAQTEDERMAMLAANADIRKVATGPVVEGTPLEAGVEESKTK